MRCSSQQQQQLRRRRENAFFMNFLSNVISNEEAVKRKTAANKNLFTHDIWTKCTVPHCGWHRRGKTGYRFFFHHFPLACALWVCMDVCALVVIPYMIFIILFRVFILRRAKEKHKNFTNNFCCCCTLINFGIDRKWAQVDANGLCASRWFFFVFVKLFDGASFPHTNIYDWEHYKYLYFH